MLEQAAVDRFVRRSLALSHASAQGQRQRDFIVILEVFARRYAVGTGRSPSELAIFMLGHLQTTSVVRPRGPVPLSMRWIIL